MRSLSLRETSVLFSFALSMVGNLSHTSHAAPASTNCSNIRYEHPVDSRNASAAVWANLRNKPGSVRFESNQIFLTAEAQAHTVRPPATLCPAGCSKHRSGEFVFRSKPSAVLNNSPERDYCADLQRSSTIEPHTYSSDQIQSVAELNDWIGELSQGDGVHGRDLYRKCDRACSPQYEYVIRRHPSRPGSYTVSASVVCGLPRDKDKNEYELQAFFRWICHQS